MTSPTQVMKGSPGACETGRLTVGHHPARFVWHHVQPQVAGGLTVPANLAGLCDNCHYMVHVLMWHLKVGTPFTGLKPTRKQLALAQRGYEKCVEAGTADKIPKEASV